MRSGYWIGGASAVIAGVVVWYALQGPAGQAWSIGLGVLVTAIGEAVSLPVNRYLDKPHLTLWAHACYKGHLDLDAVEAIYYDPETGRRREGLPDHLYGGPRTDPVPFEVCASQEVAKAGSSQVPEEERKNERATYTRMGRRALIVKFGVATVTTRGGTAEGAKATARFKLLEGSGGSLPLNREIPLGPVNWYLGAAVEVIYHDEAKFNHIFEHPDQGLNSYLGTPTYTINPGPAWCMPLFYVRKNWPGVFACGEGGPTVIALTGHDKPVRFEVELTVTANHADPATETCMCTARELDFTIKRERKMGRLEHWRYYWALKPEQRADYINSLLRRDVPRPSPSESRT